MYNGDKMVNLFLEIGQVKFGQGEIYSSTIEKKYEVNGYRPACPIAYGKQILYLC